MQLNRLLWTKLGALPSFISFVNGLLFSHQVISYPVHCSVPGFSVLPYFLFPFLFCSNSCPLVMLSNHFILCCCFLLLPSVFPSMRVFSNELALCIRWSKYWSFTFSISPSNEYPGLISFRTDWFDLLAVQVNLKSLLQHHSLKASIL